MSIARLVLIIVLLGIPGAKTAIADDGNVTYLPVISNHKVEQAPAPSEPPASQPPLTGDNVFFVAPDGKSGNKGTESSPWDLKTAFSQPSAVKPGATIYLRGGKY
ncbi:MAG: hypothetical protein GX491_18790, partial [Chloroflexi bacterium]|nr:hypothetical protein [Chloroflexota bacterium]